MALLHDHTVNAGSSVCGGGRIHEFGLDSDTASVRPTELVSECGTRFQLPYGHEEVRFVPIYQKDIIVQVDHITKPNTSCSPTGSGFRQPVQAVPIIVFLWQRRRRRRRGTTLLP